MRKRTARLGARADDLCVGKAGTTVILLSWFQYENKKSGTAGYNLVSKIRGGIFCVFKVVGKYLL